MGLVACTCIPNYMESIARGIEVQPGTGINAILYSKKNNKSKKEWGMWFKC
jgi:hypothetical protein